MGRKKSHLKVIPSGGVVVGVCSARTRSYCHENAVALSASIIAKNTSRPTVEVPQSMASC